MNTTRRGPKLLALVAASAIVFAACGSDDNSGDSATSGTDASDSTSAPDSTDATDSTTAPDSTDGGGATPGSGEVGTVGGSACGTPHGAYEAGEDPTGEVRVAWNQAAYSFNNVTNRGNATANTNPLYMMTGRRLRVLRRRPELRQQRPVRYVHDRFARPVDDHLHDQRGCHLVRRCAGRCCRPAHVVGSARAASTTTPTPSSPTPASPRRPTRTARRSSSGPTGPTSPRSTRRRTTQRSIRRRANCSTASPTRSRRASRSTPRASRSS